MLRGGADARRCRTDAVAAGAGRAVARRREPLCSTSAPTRCLRRSLPPSRSSTSATSGLWCWDTGGNGEPVVLVHPASVSATAGSISSRFSPTAGYRVIGYSRRGFQNSGRRSGRGAGNGIGRPAPGHREARSRENSPRRRCGRRHLHRRLRHHPWRSGAQPDDRVQPYRHRR